MKFGTNISIIIILAIFSLFIMSSDLLGGVIYVDDDVSPSGDGSNWSSAYTNLQDALSHASSGDEIRVAQGIYQPDQGTLVTPGDRGATFQLINGVLLYGGYAGITETNPDDRDINSYETLLSGEIGTDVLTDNSYHVLNGSGVDSSTGIDGFIIQYGYASGGYTGEFVQGGGMYNNSGDPAVSNCTFLNNRANSAGGAIYNTSSDPEIRDCKFLNNTASQVGGGIYNIQSNPQIVFCQFSNNSISYSSYGSGAGIYNNTSIPIISDCIFIDNTCDFAGGGIRNDNCNYVISNCLFIGNSGDYGGGIYNQDSNMQIINCRFLGNSGKYGGGICGGGNSIIQSIFSGNAASRWGGAIYDSGSMIIKHCIICNNNADGNVGGVYSYGGSISNSVIWGNREQTIINEYTQIHGTGNDINYCCVQGWSGIYGGTGNFNADPMLIDADGVDDIVGTEDDDVRFSIYSPCIDSGNIDYIAEDVADLDNDGDYSEPIPLDIIGNLSTTTPHKHILAISTTLSV